MDVRRIFPTSLVIVVAGGCAEPNRVEAPPHTPKPAQEIVPPAATEAAAAPESPAAPAEPDHARWLRVERMREGVAGAHATGHFIVEANKLVIATEGVAQFVMHLDRVGIDWTRRVVLRIDGDNFELTRKYYPTLRLRRTPGGNWDPVKD